MHFQNRPPFFQELTTDEWNLIKLKSFCLAKETIKQVKKKNPDNKGESLLIIHLTENWYSEYMKNSRNKESRGEKINQLH